MKVGDYVRTKNGIERITDIKEWVNFQRYEKIITIDKNQYKTLYERSEIIKSSPNIIDLIEVGDYVNGLKVSRVGETYHGRKDKAIYCDYCVDKETGKWAMIYDDEIKSIVTKEQFSQMEYRIEG